MEKAYNQVTGRIFDIQKFSIHDGPGIRTIVFLKGCPLRCKWCCNPESQSPTIQKMIRNGKEETVGRDVTVEEVMEEVLKDLPHFRRSGGGLTLSGGEALLQPDFASALLQAAKDAGINTAMESTGFGNFSSIENKILPWLDLYLMDIKHMSSSKHKLFTSQPNERILENAKKIAASGQHLIIRVPVIPTFNDTPEEILEIAQFARSLKGVTELHLLPYHRLGQDKYAGLGRSYTLAHIEPPSNEQMEMLRQVAAATGLKVQIGG
ncbi:MAG: glycyl-radical enzyme activating protein [Candidatus Limivivens sp.]|nr:glycyl-radical enzyme activating protein [Candidatus Limivivens sp.]